MLASAIIAHITGKAPQSETDGKANDRSVHSKATYTPRMAKKSFDYLEKKVSFEEARQMLMQIYQIGRTGTEGMDTPLGSKICRNNELA